MPIDLRKVNEHFKRTGKGRLRMGDLGEWLDSSKISEFNLCPRKFYYRHERGLIPFIPEASTNHANPMTFGSALHAALAVYYNGDATALVTCPCPEMEGCDFCAGQPIPNMFAQFLLHYPDDPVDDRDPRTRRRGCEILKTYVRKWGREPFEVIGTEISFALEFDGFTYIGRIDLIKKEDGRISPKDHKSTTRFGQIFEQQFKVSHQMTGYMYAIGTILGEDVMDGEINAIRVTTNITEDSFIRMTTTRTPEDFDEWKQQTQEVFLEIMRFRERGFWPKRAPFACSAYNRTCEYYDLCASGPSRREEIIRQSYTVHPWNPIEVD